MLRRPGSALGGLGSVETQAVTDRATLGDVGHLLIDGPEMLALHSFLCIKSIISEDAETPGLVRQRSS